MPDHCQRVIQILRRFFQRQHRVVERSQRFVRHDFVNPALRLRDQFANAGFDVLSPDAIERDLKIDGQQRVLRHVEGNSTPSIYVYDGIIRRHTASTISRNLRHPKPGHGVSRIDRESMGEILFGSRGVLESEFRGSPKSVRRGIVRIDL